MVVIWRLLRGSNTPLLNSPASLISCYCGEFDCAEHMNEKDGHPARRTEIVGGGVPDFLCLKYYGYTNKYYQEMLQKLRPYATIVTSNDFNKSFYLLRFCAAL